MSGVHIKCECLFNFEINLEGIIVNKKKTQEEFEECVYRMFPHLEVRGQYTGARFKIPMHCNICDGDWSTKATHMLSGHGCPYCGGRAFLLGFNDMWTTAPEVAKLLVNPEDGYNYTKNSSKKTYFQCPNCGDVSLKRISNVYYQGLCCQKCSDGISYPNKFIRSLLSQLPICDVDYEYSPDWAKPYFYDDYFEYGGMKYLVEADGEQHYKDKIFFGKTLEERRTIDNNKTSLAIENGFILIRIDCSESTMEYMKNSICNSMLSNIFDLQDIDWVRCDATSRKNIIKEVSLTYENTTKDITKLSEMFGLAKNTICSYLKIGYTCGWCSYTVEQSNRFSRFKNTKPFVVVDNEEKITHYFNGTNEDLVLLGNLFDNEFLNKCIKNSCRTHKPYKGIAFRYADEYLPKEIIDEIKLQDNAKELFFNYLKQN